MTRCAAKRFDRVTLVAAACLLAMGANAKPKGPLAKCQPTVVDGVQVCAIDMSEYAAGGAAGLAQCPTGITASGSTLLCEQSFAAAIDDARLYFAAPTVPTQPYLITIPGGTYDLSSQIAALPPRNGAIDLTGIAPASGGCLTGSPSTTGIVTLSGNPCLIISGAGAQQTTLVTSDEIIGISGASVSHIMVENMTMVQPNHSTTQGIYVSQGTQTVRGVDYSTLTLDIAAGFPTPLGLFNISCVSNGPAGCTDAGLPTVSNAIYMRAYTNEAAPQLIQSTSAQNSNAQLPWGYPSLAQKVIAAVSPTQPDPVNYPNRWKLTLSSPISRRPIPTYYSGTTAGVANLICMKFDHANAFFFSEGSAGGTDIIMNNMVWIGAARGTFRGVRGSLTGGGLGAQVYNSSIERGPAINGQVPCLSTQSGGIQIGHPTDPPVYGNAVYGLTAQGTGDDSLAMSNDIGGSRTPKGGLYPQTTIMQSVIGNSFARDIVLTDEQSRTKMDGDLQVSVDAATQADINADGNCDPLVLGNGNCPVTYVNY
jgi:hypothetical protein